MLALVNIPWDRLVAGDNLQTDIERAFGVDGLGALTISGVPGFADARKRCLGLVPRLASLPDSSLKQLQDPESSYSFGWSCGQEALNNGKRDTFKGSFYANPLVDEPCSDQKLMQKHPAYFRPNIWPRQQLPELEPAFKELGHIIIDAGRLLIDHCDRHIAAVNNTAKPGKLRATLDSSCNHKARLLHYFPADSTTDDVSKKSDQEWCGWHTDHGSLTGLTCAMHIKDGQEVENPDTTSGLYIRDRSGAVVRAVIPPDHIAFQVGEVMQINSGGLLQATPHYVKAASGNRAAGVSRNTFAVFMQPSVLEPLECPTGVTHSTVAVGQWQPGMCFGEFAEATLQKYYHVPSPSPS